MVIVRLAPLDLLPDWVERAAFVLAFYDDAARRVCCTLLASSNCFCVCLSLRLMSPRPTAPPHSGLGQCGAFGKGDVPVSLIFFSVVSELLKGSAAPVKPVRIHFERFIVFFI